MGCEQKKKYDNIQYKIYLFFKLLLNKTISAFTSIYSKKKTLVYKKIDDTKSNKKID